MDILYYKNFLNEVSRGRHKSLEECVRYVEEEFCFVHEDALFLSECAIELLEDRSDLVKKIIDEINSLSDYEVYLANKYDFLPMNINGDDVWEQIIDRESRAKFSVWYKKFIKKYYSKKLLPKKYLRKALLIAGCAENTVDVVVDSNDVKRIIYYFRKEKKKRKLRCFYAGEIKERKNHPNNYSNEIAEALSDDFLEKSEE